MKTIVETILESSDFNDKMVITISHQRITGQFFDPLKMAEVRGMM